MGSTANFRGAGLVAVTSWSAGDRFDFDDISTGSGAKRLGGASDGILNKTVVYRVAFICRVGNACI